MWLFSEKIDRKRKDMMLEEPTNELQIKYDEE